MPTATTPKTTKLVERLRRMALRPSFKNLKEVPLLARRRAWYVKSVPSRGGHAFTLLRVLAPFSA